MLSIEATRGFDPTARRLFSLLAAIIVTSSILVGAVGVTTAQTSAPEPIHSTPEVEAVDSTYTTPSLDPKDAVDNSSVIVTDSGKVITGELASYGDPAGRLIRTYEVNGLEKTEPIKARGGNVVSDTGENVIVEGGGSVGVFDEDPDIRARYTNGTVERVVVDNGNVETESGQNIVTEDGENIEVNEDAFESGEFIVNIIDTTNVGEGKTMDISAEFGNRGHAEVSKSIRVVVDDHAYTRKLLQLEPGETRELDLQYRTSTGDAPEVELKVTTPDDSDTTTVAVAEPEFRMGISESDLTVSAGETVTVPVGLARTGGSSENTYAVDFIVDGDVVDTEITSVKAGGSTDLKFSYDTSAEDTPSVLATVRGPKGTNDTVKIPVRKQILAVDQIQTPKNISEYEQINTTATIENYGTTTRNQTVKAVISNGETNETEIIGERRVELGARNTENITFTHQTTPELHPNHQLTIQTSDHQQTVTVATNATAVHQFSSGPEGNITAPRGSEFSLTPTIENIGHAGGTANVTLALNGSSETARTDRLDPGQTSTIVFNATVPNSSVTYKIATRHDTTSGTLIPSTPEQESQSEPTTLPNSEEQDSNEQDSEKGDDGGILGFLPSLTIIITTGFSVILVGVIAYVAS